MHVSFSDQELFRVAAAMVLESFLPDRCSGSEPTRKTALHKLHGAFQGDAFRRDQEMNVVRHHDKRVQLVVSLATIVLKDVDEEFSGGASPEEGKTFLGDAGGEIGSVPCL